MLVLVVSVALGATPQRLIDSWCIDLGSGTVQRQGGRGAGASVVVRLGKRVVVCIIVWELAKEGPQVYRCEARALV